MLQSKSDLFLNPNSEEINVLERVDPLKYNKGQLIHFNPSKHPLRYSYSSDYKQLESTKQKKVIHTVVIDYFESTISGVLRIDPNQEVVKLSDCISLENTYQPTARYEAKFNLYYNGNKVGLLQVIPRKALKGLGKDFMQFKLDNDLLYSEWVDDIYNEILSLMDWKHYSTTRLDIAIDGAYKAQETYLKGRNGRTIKRKGKARLSVSELSNGTINSIRIGSRSSEKHGNLYNKTAELLHSKKDHITNFWKANNLEIKGDVWRYEIRMKSKIANNYDYNMLNNPSYIASIARTETKNFFEYYYVGKDKNKYRQHKNGKMEMFDWNCIEGELLPKSKAKPKSDTFNVKIAIKALTKESYFGRVKEDHSRIISELLNEYNLRDWYEAKLFFWWCEWDRTKTAIEASKPLFEVYDN